MTWTELKWVAFGDSLTDPTIPSPLSAGNPKYHTLIARNLMGDTGTELTHVKVMGVGGTGYWRTHEAGTAFYQRMSQAAADPSVGLVTIFGSVNDHAAYVTGNPVTYALDAGNAKDGGDRVTFVDFGDPTFPSAAAIASAIARMALTDTISAGDDTYVAYVNECLNVAHQKFPNAKIVLVHEIAFYNTKAGQLQKERAIKEAIVQRRRSAGDDWLTLFRLNESRFDGIPDPERLHLNTVPGSGLSFDNGQIQDATFRAYYTYENVGHPNALYNRLWLGPMFAAIIRSCFPELAAPPAALSVGSYDVSGLWLGDPEEGGGDPDVPVDPPQPPIEGELYGYDWDGNRVLLQMQPDELGQLITIVYDWDGKGYRMQEEEPDVDDTAVLGVAVLGTMILGKAS